MTCGNNKKCGDNCKQKEQMSFSANAMTADVAKKLLEIAAAGMRAGTVLRNMVLSNPAVEALAKHISDMAVENAYLRSVVNLFSPAYVDVKDADLIINFGPGQKYSLCLPLTDKNSRVDIIKQLRAAADRLEKDINTPDNQKLLPFPDIASN